MLEIHVDTGGEEYPECPLRSDLNTCEAVKSSEVNSCPSLSEDGTIWSLPDWCPLRDGGVCVQFKDEDEDMPNDQVDAPAG